MVKDVTAGRNESRESDDKDLRLAPPETDPSAVEGRRCSSAACRLLLRRRGFVVVVPGVEVVPTVAAFKAERGAKCRAALQGEALRPPFAPAEMGEPAVPAAAASFGTLLRGRPREEKASPPSDVVRGRQAKVERAAETEGVVDDENEEEAEPVAEEGEVEGGLAAAVGPCAAAAVGEAPEGEKAARRPGKSLDERCECFARRGLEGIERVSLLADGFDASEGLLPPPPLCCRAAGAAAGALSPTAAAASAPSSSPLILVIARSTELVEGGINEVLRY